MRVLALVTVLATMGAMSASADAITVPTEHPLVGKWQWTRGSDRCSEVFDFRADGTVPVTSGTERTENAFTIVSIPATTDFYRVTITTTKDHGGRDCAEDDSDSTGVESTNFILFNPARTQYLACHEADLQRCFGPFERIDQ